jgi:mRNA interferase MazF
MVKTYVPGKGDLVWLSFDPTRGHEQKGKRPALVISSSLFNKKSGMAYVCPITSVHRNYPYRVGVEEGKVSGFVMVDNLRSIDWQDRSPDYISTVPDGLIAEVMACIQAITE